MCGIFFEICANENSVFSQDKNIFRLLNNRGPDCSCHLNISCNDLRMTFFGSVLWMQGSSPIQQPVETENGILLYNGDIFDTNWDINSSDTKLILDKCESSSKFSGQEQERFLVEEIKKFNGPFSIIYYHKTTHCLYFSRDRIGRNSLLLFENNGNIILSSVLGRDYKCIEVPASSMYVLNIMTKQLKLYSWEGGNASATSFKDWLRNVQCQQMLPDEEQNCDLLVLETLEDEDNVIQEIEKIAIESKCKMTLLEQIMGNKIILRTLNTVLCLLERSVQIRLERQQNKCKDCILSNGETCPHCSVGILFSGGLDCTILAMLADRYVPKEQPIDLINVAFGNNKSASFDVPDRLTGRQSIEELKKCCPSRNWLFKEVDVQKEELENYQKLVIADLVHPRQTILDESLGSALWFASKCDTPDAASSCRVLLLGSGADELFGGYSRHRNAFKRKGWTGLSNELLLDWKRISFRNLARDNRVICDHGRQPRLPYLDEEFANYVLNLKPWLRCYPSETLGAGIGDKLMLRLVAYKLGLKQVALFPKRALQFGSRIANKKEKGSDISKNFIKETPIQF